MKLLILCCIISAITIWYMQGTPLRRSIQPFGSGEHSTMSIPRPSSEVPDVNESGSHFGYLTALYIHEQFTSALNAVVQLYNLSEHYWKLKLFEPYVVNTEVTLVPSLKISQSTPFSTFFDKHDALTKLQHCFNSSINLTSYTDFLVKAARTFVYVYISKTKEKITKPISECKMNLRPIEKRLNQQVKEVAHLAIAEHGKDYFFTGKKAVCIKTNSEHPLSMSRIGPYIRRLITPSCKNNSELCLPRVTLVLSQWRRMVKTKSNFFFVDPEYKDHMSDCQVSSFTPTALIVSTAQQFYQSLSLNRPFIAIHIRTEKLLERSTTGFLDKCMKELNNTLYISKNKYNITQESVVMIYDVRKGGSNSIYAPDKQKFAKDVVTRVRSMNISIVEFDPATLNITHLPGLVPLVEKEFLASADVLVAIGGGSFQATIIKRYQQLHSQGDLYTPCH